LIMKKITTSLSIIFIINYPFIKATGTRGEDSRVPGVFCS
jgi:hypothetical protein